MNRGYEEYKDTNYDWLPLIPSHWEQKTIRSITKLSDKRCGSRKNLELLSVYREYGVIKKNSRDDNHNVESENLSNYKYVKKGNLVMNKMKMWQGSLGISDFEGIVSPAYIVCDVITDANLRYLHFLLRSPMLKTFYNRISYGIRVGQWDMRYDDLKSLCLFLPPRSEQDQIVRYLDWKVSMINKYINAKKKQIELLKEQKQAIIDYAVTKEQNQNYRFRNLFTLIKGLNITKDDLVDTGIPCVSYGEIHSRYGFEVNPDIHFLRCVDKKYIQTNSKSLLNFGDFVFADTSEDIAGSGNFTYLNSKTQAFAGYHTIIARPKAELNFRYLAYFFDSSLFRRQIQQSVNGVKVYSITRSILNDTCIKLPSSDKQQAIVAYLDKQCEYINKLVEQSENEINLLNEYRTRLISDVVTGKVDVRGVRVPEEIAGEIEVAGDEGE